MSRYYRRIEGGRKTSIQAGLVAGGIAAAVGAVSYYMVRLILSREPLGPVPETFPPRDAANRESDGE
jgi:hypothetical protein